MNVSVHKSSALRLWSLESWLEVVSGSGTWLQGLVVSKSEKHIFRKSSVESTAFIFSVYMQKRLLTTRESIHTAKIKNEKVHTTKWRKILLHVLYSQRWRDNDDVIPGRCLLIGSFCHVLTATWRPRAQLCFLEGSSLVEPHAPRLGGVLGPQAQASLYPHSSGRSKWMLGKRK